MDPSFADRYLNEGFSGGEKKRNEILQMAILEPELAILDETDSGLDIDALRVVAKGVREVRADPPAARACWPSPTTSGCSTSCSPTGAHHDRRPHRRERRARARRATRSATATTHGADRSAGSAPRIALTDDLDVAAIKADFPLLDRRSASTATRSSTSTRPPRRRSPRPCSTRWTTSTSHSYANVHRGVYRIAAEATDRYEQARAKVAALHRGAVAQRRSCSPRTSPRRINLVAYSWGRANLAAGRRGRAHRDGAPRQPRALADAAAGAGHRAALPALTRRLPARPDRPRPAARRRQAAQRHRHVQRARHAHPGAPPRRRRPRRRGPVPGRRRPVRAAPAPPTSPSSALRLLRLHRPQDARPHRHRRAVGPRGAARGHAAVPRRRRDDPRRPPRRLDAPTTSRGSSRPAPRRSSRPSAWARPSTTSTGWAWTRSGRHEVALTDYALRTLGEALRRRPHHPRPARADQRGGVLSFAFKRRAPPRHLPGARRARRVRAGRPPLRQAADAGPRRRRHRPSLALPVQRRGRRRRPGRRARRGRRLLRPDDLRPATMRPSATNRKPA